MGAGKQHAKLLNLQTKAQECISRKEARKIIRKADKAHQKLAR
tara:strand:+ start:144 stop:272 length:129 start_codon:yes stop_codon:yes gene_type:complete